MAFIDHDVLHSKLAQGWALLDDGLNVEKKLIIKRIRNLEGDKNADPALIAKLQNTKNDIEARKVKVLVEALKYRYMNTVPMENFKTQTAKEIYDAHRETSTETVKQKYGKQKH